MARPNLRNLFINLEPPPFINGQKRIRENTFFKTNVLKFPNNDKEFPFLIDDFEELAILHTSRHVVKKFLHKPSGNIVAIKYLPYYSNELILAQISREFNTQRFAASSPYVVDFYGLCFHGREALIVMEYMHMSLKNLYSTLNKNNTKISYKLLGLISVALLNCMLECHKLGILHRDFKPHNILINETGEVKLCDFGESRIAVDYASTKNVGTVAYWAPERFQCDMQYNAKADIWSLGMTLAELALGRYPFEEELMGMMDTHSHNIFRIHNIVTSGNPYEVLIKVDNHLEHRHSDFFWFLNYCLQSDFNKRCSAVELLDTDLYKKFTKTTHRDLFDEIRTELELLKICFFTK